MVYPDLNYQPQKEVSYKSAVPVRILAFIIDYFIFVPFVSFIVLILFRSGMDIYKTFPKSDEAQSIFSTVIFGFIFVITFFQALFITFWKATPGQYFLKLRIEFKNKNYPIFLQAWTRQLGFIASFLFLGFPFLKTLADENGQCFYEKMTDSEVISLWPIHSKSYFHPKFLDQDRKFWSAGLATINTFLFLIGAVVVWNSYQVTLTSPGTYAKTKTRQKTCLEFNDLDSTERLRFAIAMNLAGTVTDECLDQEADFVLWRNKTSDQSLAYFAKSLTASNNDFDADSETDSQKYLNQACIDDPKAEGCFWSQLYQSDEISKLAKHTELNKSILGLVMRYQNAGSVDLTAKAQLLTKLQKFSEYKSVKKFIILENLEQLNAQNTSNETEDISSRKRKPANLNEVGSDVKSRKNLLIPYDEIKEMIQDI